MGLVSAGPRLQSITHGCSLGGDSSFLTCSVPAPSRRTCTRAEQPSEGAAQQLNAQDKPDPALCPKADTQGGTSRWTPCHPQPCTCTQDIRAMQQAVEHTGLLYRHTAQRGPCLPAASGDRSPWPSKQDITPPGGTTKSPSTELHAHKPTDSLMADSCCHPRSKGDRQAAPPDTTPAACHRASTTGAAAATSQPLSPNAAGARWQCSGANWPGREPGGTRGPGTTTSRLLAPAGEMVRSWWPRSPVPGLCKAAWHHSQLCLSRLCRTHHGAGR